MTRPPLPAAFDPATYRHENPDLALADDAAAAAHYEGAGRAEGRVASPLARREGLIAAIGDGRTLEIGPFCNPLLRGPHIEYLDRLDAAALRARAIAIGIDPAGCPDRIHHVGGLESVPGSYANIVASHSIEHHPDLVRHLEQVGRLLEPGGRYWLIVPDKRFCFDHFLPESSIADALAAYDEAREAHSLKSVVEHVALVTHNDPVRHWAGDHGEVPAADLPRRVAEATDAYRQGRGGYVDVHAWQFTPDSFRRLMTVLKGLGRTLLDVEQVYDTPRDRLEFCAVLRRPAGHARVSPRGTEGGDIVMMQTADPYLYAPMLAVTARSVSEYCRRFGMRYEAFLGVKRGHHLWQATFNRIVMLQELLDRGVRGWAVYCDADAYVHDLGFDLPAYLSRQADRGAIFATSGVTGEAWDVNAGVAFVNLGHPQGRRLVRLWSEAFAAVSDERLRTGELWFAGDNDQDLLQQILGRDEAIAAATLIEPMEFINSPWASFIRQHLRAQTGDLRKRIEAIAADVDAVLAAWGVPQPLAGAVEAPVRARLRNPVAFEPALVEAPAAPPRRDLAAAAIAAFRAHPAATGASSPALEALAALLAAGDEAAVAAELAALGRAGVGQGILGGRRQHARAARDPAFARARALQTYDALVSLAEATGAVAIEQPHAAGWGASAALPPHALVEAVTRTLGVALTPPPTIGGHLGIEAGYDTVVHLRMIEGAYAAWRVRETLGRTGGGRVVELGGGAGFAAWYAGALGVADYAIVDDAAMAAIQAYVLGDARGVRLVASLADAGPADLVLNEDSFADRDDLYVEAAFATLRAVGARALLSLNPEAAEGRRAVAAIAADHGWRRVARHHHGVRPGFVEELFVPA